MPKRKRETHDNNGNAAAKRQKDVCEQYTQSKKILHRAFKIAKGFERQKLGKRLKIATSNVNAVDMARIRREIDVLKGLELSKVTEAHLNRTLLKIKAFTECDLLPDEVRTVLPKPEGSEDKAAALHNVTSGMCNTKHVKEAMNSVLKDMYAATGIPTPVAKPKEQKEPMKGIVKEPTLREMVPPVEESDSDLGEENNSSEKENDEPTWEGFKTAENDKENERPEQTMDIDSLDEDELSRYDALLGGSSSEESFDEEEYRANRASNRKPPPRQTLSLSPSPPEDSDIDSSADTETESEPIPQAKPLHKANAKATKKQPPPKPTGSTFLPTLMGGYWSGSESASDLEDDPSTAAPIRKNRPGQMARRAIWEKKFGTGANHIKTGLGSVADMKVGKDDGWDVKRGAKDSERGRGRGRGRGEGRKRDFSTSKTGENAVAVTEVRKRGLGKKDDVGVLHPSWQAAKKAKEAKSTAKFEGKKVTFN